MNVTNINNDDFSLYSSKVEILAIICGCLSCVGSLSILLTVSLFPSMLRKKKFMVCLVMVSLCDFMGSFAVAFGFPVGSLCVFQGSMIYFWYRASYIWTCFMSLSLYSLIFYGTNQLLTNVQMHLICWSVNIMIELIPLSTTNYGGDDYTEGDFSCFFAFADRPKAAILWEIICFIMPLLISSFVLLLLSVRVYWRVKKIKVSPLITSVVEFMFLYPISMLICWGPSIALSFAFFSVNKKPHVGIDTALNVALQLGSLYGMYVL